MNKRIFYILTGIVVFLFAIYQFAKTFSPGSYSNAEIYTLNFPENKVQEAIKIVKKNNLNLIVTDSTFRDTGKREEYWIFNYFNLNNRRILTWTRPKNDSITNFAFVRIQDNNFPSRSKDINRDLKKDENNRIIKEFEKQILNEIVNELSK